MAKVIATVKFSGVLVSKNGVKFWTFFAIFFWEFLWCLETKSEPNIDGVLIESRLETRRGPDKYLFFKSSGLDWRQSIERNAWTIWWCGQHTNPTTSSKSNMSPPISRAQAIYNFYIEIFRADPHNNLLPNTLLICHKTFAFCWN